MENENLLNLLVEIFLSYRDADKGYFRVIREIKKLRRKSRYIDINDVQCIAYNCRMDGGR